MPSTVTGRRAQAALLLTSVLTATLVLAAGHALAQTTPLDDYVYARPPDPAYQWWIDHQASGPGWTRYSLRMDSGTWRTAAEVDKTLWKHYLNVFVPDVISKDTALLVVEGGSAGSSIDDPLGSTRSPARSRWGPARCLRTWVRCPSSR